MLVKAIRFRLSGVSCGDGDAMKENFNSVSKQVFANSSRSLRSESKSRKLSDTLEYIEPCNGKLEVEPIGTLAEADPKHTSVQYFEDLLDERLWHMIRIGKNFISNQFDDLFYSTAEMRQWIRQSTIPNGIPGSRSARHSSTHQSSAPMSPHFKGPNVYDVGRCKGEAQLTFC